MDKASPIIRRPISCGHPTDNFTSRHSDGNLYKPSQPSDAAAWQIVGGSTPPFQAGPNSNSDLNTASADSKDDQIEDFQDGIMAIGGRRLGSDNGSCSGNRVDLKLTPPEARDQTPAGRSRASPCVSSCAGCVFGVEPPQRIRGLCARRSATRRVVVNVQTELRDVTHPMGHDLEGLIIYSPDGYMSGQLMKLGRPVYASGDIAHGTTEEPAAAAAGYLAYSGPYYSDEEAATLRQHKSVSLCPNWIATPKSASLSSTATPSPSPRRRSSSRAPRGRLD